MGVAPFVSIADNLVFGSEVCIARRLLRTLNWQMAFSPDIRKCAFQVEPFCHDNLKDKSSGVYVVKPLTSCQMALLGSLPGVTVAPCKCTCSLFYGS